MDLIINGNLIAPDGSILYAKREMGGPSGAGTVADPFVFSDDNQFKERLLQVPGNLIAVVFVGGGSLSMFPVVHKTVSYLAAPYLGSFNLEPNAGKDVGNDTVIKCIGISGTISHYSWGILGSQVANLVFENCVLRFDFQGIVPDMRFNSCVFQNIVLYNNEMTNPSPIFDKCYFEGGVYFSGDQYLTPIFIDCFSLNDYLSYSGITQESAFFSYDVASHIGSLNPAITSPSGTVGPEGGSFPWTEGTYPAWFSKIGTAGYLLKNIATQKWYTIESDEVTLEEITEPASVEDFIEKAVNFPISAHISGEWPDAEHLKIVSISKQSLFTMPISSQEFNKLEMTEDIVFTGLDPARADMLNFQFIANSFLVLYSIDGGETYLNANNEEVDMSKPLEEIYNENPTMWGLDGIPINQDGTLSIRFFFIYYHNPSATVHEIYANLPVQGAMKKDRDIDIYTNGNGDFFLKNIYFPTIEVDCII
jgi:hypothetical protein